MYDSYVKIFDHKMSSSVFYLEIFYYRPCQILNSQSNPEYKSGFEIVLRIKQLGLYLTGHKENLALFSKLNNVFFNSPACMVLVCTCSQWNALSF